MQHAYDFYKPDLTSEYPVIDGAYSVRCYTEAVDACYKAYNTREASLQKNGLANGVHELSSTPPTPLDRFDHVLFHSPTCKLVAKSYARMLYNDYRENPSNPLFESVPKEIRDLDYQTSISDKMVEKTFLGLTKKTFQTRVQPSIQVPTMCGNMYCASVYGALVSLLANVPGEQLKGKRVGIFSYGSGLASSFFSMRVVGDVSEMVTTLDLHQRLDARRTVAPEVYDEVGDPWQRKDISRRRLIIILDVRTEGKGSSTERLYTQG